MFARRVAAATAAAGLLAAHLIAPPAAWAIAPPVIDPGALPPDGPPGPSEPMRQMFGCAAPAVIPDPNVSQPAPGNVMLNLPQAWEYSTGAGVTVAVIDTGVTPNPRFPRLFGGGDFVMGEASAGLTDCESHGTIVASIIGAAPADPADRPPAKPAGVPVAPPPPGVVPAPAAPPPPAEGEAPAPPPGEAPAPPPGEAPPPPPGEAPAPPPPGDTPQAGPGDAGGPQPLVPGPPPGTPDGVVGVAPDATLISIRQSSPQFGPANPSPADIAEHRKAGDILTLARAIRHAADLGADVINVSLASCINPAVPVNQAPLGAAIRYAAVEKDAVIIAAAGNRGDPLQPDCQQNPVATSLDASDPRNWAGVTAIVTPAWFSDYVLAVGAVSPDGLPMPDSIAGPWVGAAAPGYRIMGLSSTNGAPVNALPDNNNPGTGNGYWGSSFSAAYVSGVAALVRAKFPNLTAREVIQRITGTAHNPAQGVDNQVGYGVVDPVAALTFDVAAPRATPDGSTTLHVPPPPPPPDTRGRTAALLGTALVLGAAGAFAGVRAIRRRMP